MTTLSSLLDVLCDNRYERRIADVICSPGNQRNREFWVDVHTALVDSSRSVCFEDYPVIARCHVLCMGTAPDNGDMWTSIVLEGLTHRLVDGAGFTAFVMGSQLGLFQAGTWLQEQRQTLIGQNFLRTVAQYCTELLGQKCLPVNISGSNSASAMTGARQELDRAVKKYLRPQQRDLIALIKPEICIMLSALQQASISEDRFDTERGYGADRWLLDSLVHGSLGFAHRNSNELIQAALAINA